MSLPRQKPAPGTFLLPAQLTSESPPAVILNYLQYSQRRVDEAEILLSYERTLVSGRVVRGSLIVMPVSYPQVIQMHLQMFICSMIVFEFCSLLK